MATKEKYVSKNNQFLPPTAPTPKIMSTHKRKCVTFVFLGLDCFTQNQCFTQNELPLLEFLASEVP